MNALLESKMETVVKLDEITEADGFGGFVHTWVPGARFMAAIIPKSSTEAQIAYQSGVKAIYTVYTKQIAKLRRNDRIRRESSGRVLRVTTDAVEDGTPGTSVLDLCRVSAEVVEP